MSDFAINQLMEELKHNKETAVAFVNSKGRCTYCGIDLLSDWHNYQGSAIDHILPKAKYPDLAMNEDNLVFSCTACNTIKHNFDPLQETAVIENPAEYLLSHREELIEKVRKYIFSKVKKMRVQMNRAFEIIYGL
jgi:5-methylcytosine-specific restriction endonuclease McrA